MNDHVGGRTARSAAQLGRRGILGAALGLVVGLSDRLFTHGSAQASGPSVGADPATAQALPGTRGAREVAVQQFDPTAVHMNTTNFATSPTILSRTSGTSQAFQVFSNSGGAILAFTSSGNSIHATSQSGIALAASNGAGWGAFLDSQSGVGFQGRSISNIGVLGSTNNGQPLAAGQAPLNAFAGYFVGGHGVFIDGDLKVTGMKSAVIPGRDGAERRVYCVESPRAFFEDFGEAQCGPNGVTVKLDDEFAAIVDNTDYLVFLTPYGETPGLYVADRTDTGFTVKQQAANGPARSAANVKFAYRIVAPRKDAPKTRLPKATRPSKEAFREGERVFDREKERVENELRTRGVR